MQTTDYSKFHYLETNRELCEKHVQELMASFKKTGGNLSPALISKTNGVLDGQHSLEASKRVKTPFKYEPYTGPLDDEEVMIEMNIHSKNWNNESFARHAAKVGKPGYAAFIDVFEETGISFSALTVLCRTTKTKIERAEPVTIPSNVKIMISTLFDMSKQFKAVSKYKPRDEVLAKAMNLVTDELENRASRGDTFSTKNWSYDRVIKNLSSVLDDMGVSDNARAVYGKLSEAYDYRLKDSNKLNLG